MVSLLVAISYHENGDKSTLFNRTDYFVFSGEDLSNQLRASPELFVSLTDFVSERLTKGLKIDIISCNIMSQPHFIQ